MQLTVGDIAETVTVSGASPVVDIQNIEQRTVMDREVIDSIPTGKSMQNYGLLVPGMVPGGAFGSSLTQDAGGLTARTMQQLMIHGSSPTDQMVNINGMDVADPSNQGADVGFFPDTNFEEMAFNYAANAAEFESGGVNVNLIPKEGANTFSGSFFTTFSFKDLLADNLDQEMRDAGLSATALEENWTINPSIGGPIVEDRVWFFAAHTSRVANLAASGVFKALDPGALVYEPDRSRPAIDETTVREQNLNLTIQATAKDKVKLYWSNNSTDQPFLLQGRALGALFLSPEAAVNSVTRVNVYQGTWTRPHTNRLLFEAAFSHTPILFDNRGSPDAVRGVTGVLEVAPLQATRNASAWLRGAEDFLSPKNVNFYRGSMSYVTGTHNLKFGFSLNQQRDNWGSIVGRGEQWSRVWTALGLPFSVSHYMALSKEDNAATLGIYAQEQWTLDRLTVNAGVRFDRTRTGYPEQERITNQWITTPFIVQANNEVSVWKDLQPRLGLAYDLRGDGKTALKFSASRYGRRAATDWANSVNPAVANNESIRTWLDGAAGHPVLGIPPVFPSCIGPVECIPGDGIVQGDPTNPLPNGEILNPQTNLGWGLPQITTFHDPDWAFGWGNRESEWEISGSVQQELMSGVSLDVGYFRRHTINIPVVDDRAVGPEDFVVAVYDVPADSRLPDGGGGTLSFFDLMPDSVRVPDLLTVSSDNFGQDTRTWQGFDFTLDARIEDVLLQGGVSTGSFSYNYCDVQAGAPETQPARAEGFLPQATNNVNESTMALEHCDRTEAWLTQVKLLGSYTLPYDIQIAATLQNQPGPERKAIVTIAGEQTSLGRPFTLFGGAAATINLLDPQSDFGDRFNQLDLRFTKFVNLGGTARFRAMFDLYNVFNANSPTAENPAFGANYLDPVTIMPGRLAKFAFQLDF